MKLSIYEKRNYILNDKKDLIILEKIKKLEKNKLDRNDKEIIRLIKTQLKHDWRNPLIDYLNRSLKKYR